MAKLRFKTEIFRFADDDTKPFNSWLNKGWDIWWHEVLGDRIIITFCKEEEDEHNLKTN